MAKVFEIFEILCYDWKNENIVEHCMNLRDLVLDNHATLDGSSMSSAKVMTYPPQSIFIQDEELCFSLSMKHIEFKFLELKH